MEILIRDLPVYYEAAGAGQPILLLHGYTPDHRLMMGCWEPVFAKRPGYRRFYPDLPGMGRTPGADWIKSSDDMLEIVLEFIEQVLPEGQFILAGESYGGYLARGIVRRMADRITGLCLQCPCIVADRLQRTRPEHVTLVEDASLLTRLPPADAEEFSAMAVVQSEAVWRRYRDEIICGLRLADTAFLNRLQETGYALSFPVDELSAPFTRPTLFTLGRQDASVGYKDAWRILDNFPRATFAVLDRAGHCLELEQQQLFECLADEWLDRVATE